MRTNRRGRRGGALLLLAALLAGCSQGPSISANSMVIHVVAEDCETARDIGPVLLEYETVETAPRGQTRAGGDIIGWATLAEHDDYGCAVAGDLAVLVLHSSHAWERDRPFSARLGYDLGGTNFAAPADSRLRIDFEHVFAGAIRMSSGTAEWNPADRWPPAAAALADRQDCERRPRDGRRETAGCHEWRTADLRTFETDGPGD